VKVLVVDDEPIARRRLVRLLEGEDGVELVGSCGSGAEAVATVLEAPPDLVLLDVQMPGMDGFGVIREVGPDRMPRVVFVTAHGEHAARAFEVHALDYLLKPFTVARLRQALEHARASLRTPQRLSAELLAVLERLHGPESGAAPRAAAPAPERTEWFTVKDRGRVRLVPADSVDWIEAEDNYVRLHVGGAAYLVRERIGALAARLDPRRFLRTHRSTIVNMDRIEHLRPWSSGDYLLTLRDGTELRLSRGQRARLGRHIGEYS
jgi:two-component system LytT family response regulator